MRADEQAIRDLVAEWMSAIAARELSRLLGLMDSAAGFLRLNRCGSCMSQGRHEK